MNEKLVQCPWCGAENRLWNAYWFIAGLLTFGFALLIPSVCSNCSKSYLPTEVRKRQAKWILIILFLIAPVLAGIIMTIVQLAGK